MLQELSNLVVADNTGAKRAMCFRILGQRKEYAHLGDFIRVAIKEASPTGAVKKGSVATAVVIRTGNPIRRADGSACCSTLPRRTRSARACSAPFRANCAKSTRTTTPCTVFT